MAKNAKVCGLFRTERTYGKTGGTIASEVSCQGLKSVSTDSPSFILETVSYAFIS